MVPDDRFLVAAGAVNARQCVECHQKVTPNIVQDWQLSAHAKFEIGCGECHGEGHMAADDVDKVELPTPHTCAQCHKDRFAEFSRGKHAVAWAAMKAMPTAHWQPLALMQGMKGCGGCHKIGMK